MSNFPSPISHRQFFMSFFLLFSEIVARDLHCKCIYYPSPTHSVCEDIVVTLLVIPSTCIRGRDIVITLLVIPSTCIRGRDIVIAPLVRVYVCVSVCLSVCVSPVNS